jgi:hypothetical protein
MTFKVVFVQGPTVERLVPDGLALAHHHPYGHLLLYRRKEDYSFGEIYQMCRHCKFYLSHES